jgi:hypothetical protein
MEAMAGEGALVGMAEKREALRIPIGRKEKAAFVQSGDALLAVVSGPPVPILSRE